MRRLRISAISFLNTAPLMWNFEHGVPPVLPERASYAPAGNDFEIAYTIPSRCADELRAGTADIGIIPAITYATIPDLIILPDAVIAARGAVRSILLVCKTPWDRVRTIAADTSSRTSVALLEILCRKFLGGARELQPMAPELGTMLATCDAALLIGDPALKVDRTRYEVYDLAELWRKQTGKAFVFAVWAARLAALGERPQGLDVAAVFRESRDAGTRPDSIAAIARQWAPRVNLPEAEVTSYLTHNIHFTMDAECQDGLQLFFRFAAECGVISEAPDLRFFGTAACRF